MTRKPVIRTIVPASEHRQSARHNRPLQVLVLALSMTGCSIPGPSADKIAMEELDRQSIDLERPQNFTLSYLRGGAPDGAQVVFVHGTPGEAQGWADYILDPAAGAEYIAVDRPGFGQSGPDGAVTSLAGQAEALAALLGDGKGRKPILVGHSLGGPIIAQAAADFPDRIGGLVIVAGSLDPDLEQIHFMQYVGEWWPVRSLLPRAIRNSNRELMALEAELRGLQPRLETIDIPVVIVHGTKDTLVPFENVAYMEREFSGTDKLEVMVLEDRNHFLPWHSKDVIDEAIVRVAELMSEP